MVDLNQEWILALKCKLSSLVNYLNPGTKHLVGEVHMEEPALSQAPT